MKKLMESRHDMDGKALDASDAPALDIQALLNRVAAAIAEIEQAKQVRSEAQVRAARTHLAALHGVARLRRHAESQSKAA